MISEDHKQQIRVLYSDFDGNPHSATEIAFKLNLPVYEIRRFLKNSKFSHSSLPFSREALASTPANEIKEILWDLKEVSVRNDFDKAAVRKQQDSARNWDSFEVKVLERLEAAAATRPPAKFGSVVRLEKSHAVVVGLSDLHWGKYSDEGTNKERYNREIASKRVFDATEKVLVRLPSVEKFIVPIGSDFLHIDTDLNTTTKGTHQDVDGNPFELLETGCHFMEQWINRLLDIAPVDLVLMSANHDRMTGLAILLYLEAVFRNDPRVNVDRNRSFRAYVQYGQNLIGFVHGDGVKKLGDLAGHMAREASDLWGRTKHRVIYTGHYHYEKREIDTAFGVIRHQLPSLSGTDRWHSLHGFQGSPKALPFFVHHHDEGVINVLYGKP